MSSERKVAGLFRSPIVSFLLGLMAAVTVFSSCSTDRNPGDLLVPQGVGTLVVSGLLVVGEPFPEIFLTRTLAPTAVFNLEAVMVRGVRRFHIQSDDGSEFVRYREQPFWYQPDLPGAIVQPETTYHLLVQTAQDEELVAVTTTPAEFSVSDWVLLNDDGTHVEEQLVEFDPAAHSDEEVYSENVLTYSRGLLESQFRRPDVPAFQIGIESLDLGSDYAIDPDFFEDEDFENLERVDSSPPLIALDGTIRLPWFAIYFQGRYKIKIYAMDENWFDLARSLPDFGGGPGFGGQVGDNFERPIFRVEGGIGLFGSAAVDSIGFFIVPG